MWNKKKSRGLFERASRVIQLGVNSDIRYWGDDGTLYVDQAEGAYIWDVDGNRYIDYRLGFGPIILGYRYDAVDRKVVEAIRDMGVSFGLTTELEVSAVERIADMCPGIEKARMVSTGTEATMHAVRLARGFTGREKIIKFEGGYHGAHDYVLFSTYAPPEAYGSVRDPVSIPASSGIPGSLYDLIVTLPFNDPEALDRTLKRCGHDVAAVITEPMLGNFGSIEPVPGFLEHLRDRCDEYGALLVFDEVKTGFRIARGGAHEVYGVLPDLTCYAKSMGNGYPVAAYGGRADVMSIVGRGVKQGGTYSGNTVAAAAADATLEILQVEPVHESIAVLGRKLQNGLRSIFESLGLPVLISRHPSIFTVSIGIEEVRDARDWARSDRAFYRRMAEEAWSRGVLIDEDPREPWCLCYSHSEGDIDQTLNVMEEAVRSAKD
jgi:glutamate-1-semialdehyde 2,1-aminomutase